MMNGLVSSESGEEVGEEGTIRWSRHDEIVRTTVGEVVKGFGQRSRSRGSSQLERSDCL